MPNEYTTVIGLEVHVQLSTQSKLFCGCATTFGASPNTQTCPVCIGLPGSLPVMNQQAVLLAAKTGLAINCQIAASTKWDRKQYYYPDLPKGYQISQYDQPIAEGGWLEIADPKGRFEPKRVRIIRAHLEEDAGKSMHDEVAGRADSVIDLNRTGTPLLEIVSEPDLRSSAEARAYLTELRLLLTYLGVSDCNMQEGSLRVDANVNLHIDGAGGKAATPIVEIKNMNSFRAVERAIDYEADRQWRVWQETGQKIGDVPKQTRGWDDASGVTRGQRSKEESSDYRYFPDPDLAPVELTESQVEELRGALGELPAALRSRLETSYGLSPYDADVMVNQGRPLVEYYLVAADRSGDPSSAANWVTQHVLRVLKGEEHTLDTFPVGADRLAALIQKTGSGDLPGPRAREAFDLMVEAGIDVEAAMDRLGIAAVDESALVEICRTLLAANTKIVADVLAGKQQAVGALIGQAKKQNPNADPGRVRAICLELIAADANG
ncbi:Aspartyl/glutamyl-tRNA(Asn/Gln) amidotransferase subunit B [Pirellulimonas nuda]|uniref:Aspartyl/glutamyl-tRNA(Asn/Gln) amidotransferase subunit B n=1 Tax=Pirellulimonas nuda TaxID=2528009 RepID=A0A518DB22_9BACT|nr:Asp-tRNA(Asn)/Glu-tRNA(Gln) amidotransferase subunit GatB [Pirellulimonas nuda]QDU88662.1 Aspartyl/glutamyl-tRNA(Asn/Gln) amidotransferase subunit B [Pirellulimonas nuda]